MAVNACKCVRSAFKLHVANSLVVRKFSCIQTGWFSHALRIAYSEWVQFSLAQTQPRIVEQKHHISHCASCDWAWKHASFWNRENAPRRCTSDKGEQKSGSTCVCVCVCVCVCSVACKVCSDQRLRKHRDCFLSWILLCWTRMACHFSVPWSTRKISQHVSSTWKSKCHVVWWKAQVRWTNLDEKTNAEKVIVFGSLWQDKVYNWLSTEQLQVTPSKVLFDVYTLFSEEVVDLDELKSLSSDWEKSMKRFNTFVFGWWHCSRMFLERKASVCHTTSYENVRSFQNVKSPRHTSVCQNVPTSFVGEKSWFLQKRTTVEITFCFWLPTNFSPVFRRAKTVFFGQSATKHKVSLRECRHSEQNWVEVVEHFNETNMSHIYSISSWCSFHCRHVH